MKSNFLHLGNEGNCCCVLQIVYLRGTEAYNSEDFEGTIKHMEDALVEYLEEYERCELLCEGRYDHEAFPELYNSIAGKK